MRLLTKALEDELQKARDAAMAAEASGRTYEATVRAKFFTPWAGWTWYVIDADHVVDRSPSGEITVDDIEFFGYVDGLEAELGYFWLSELAKITGPGGLKIERDLHWTPQPLEKVIAEVTRRRGERVYRIEAQGGEDT